VAVEWVSGFIPTAYFYDSNGIELSKRELGDMDLQELNRIFEETGFVPLRPNLVYPDTPTATGVYGGHQYELYRLNNFFDAALEFASTRKLNGDSGYLVTVTNQAENDFIERFLMEHGTLAVWLGAKDDEEGQWKWISGPEQGVSFWEGGSDGTGSTYAHWRQGEPNNVDDEDCAVIFATDGQWNDAVCGRTKVSLLVEFGTKPLEMTLEGTEKSDL